MKNAIRLHPHTHACGPNSIHLIRIHVHSFLLHIFFSVFCSPYKLDCIQFPFIFRLVLCHDKVFFSHLSSMHTGFKIYHFLCRCSFFYISSSFTIASVIFWKWHLGMNKKKWNKDNGNLLIALICNGFFGKDRTLLCNGMRNEKNKTFP